MNPFREHDWYEVLSLDACNNNFTVWLAAERSP